MTMELDTMDTRDPAAEACNSLEEVRARIDGIDRRIVALIAERGACVTRAAAFKASTDAVRAPARVEQVIGKVRALAEVAGADPAVVERTYRAMIAAFIEAELATHAALGGGADGTGAPSSG